ncbi:hypothetical protein OEZ85_013585 [Tetradesmus obliquus]|uniref:Peptidase C1A papain C-terminal domain-containing protein n=1 Tax=Tetradesmus obliquus TaxID=3088 RepID=A0ABY8UU81_TETOB|nr:hypothetical protein OEZ85_013585 [Tetradesmus obliquus]
MYYIAGSPQVHDSSNPQHTPGGVSYIGAINDQKLCSTCVGHAVPKAIQISLAATLARDPHSFAVSPEAFYYCAEPAGRSCKTGWDIPEALRAMTNSPQTIQRHIRAHGAVVTRMVVNADFEVQFKASAKGKPGLELPPYRYNVTARPSYAHAAVITGYDNQEYTWTILNSWGTGKDPSQVRSAGVTADDAFVMVTFDTVAGIVDHFGLQPAGHEAGGPR